MINRKLNSRELEILHMIRPTNFWDIVEIVRKEVDCARYDARKKFKELKNGNGKTEDNADNPNIDSIEYHVLSDGGSILDGNDGNDGHSDVGNDEVICQ